MATYNVNLNEQEELKLTDILEMVNVQRAEENPPLPAVGKPALVNSAIREKIDEAHLQYRDWRRARISQAYMTASPSVKQQINALLGV